MCVRLRDPGCRSVPALKRDISREKWMRPLELCDFLAVEIDPHGEEDVFDDVVDIV